MMGMLTEILDVRQIPNEPRRRWFRGDDLDLIVWCDDAGVPTGFQPCSDKLLSEHALTWTPELGFLHTLSMMVKALASSTKRHPSLLLTALSTLTVSATASPRRVRNFLERLLSSLRVRSGSTPTMCTEPNQPFEGTRGSVVVGF